MPYIWLALVLYFGVWDDVFRACLVSLFFIVLVWADGELDEAAALRGEVMGGPSGTSSAAASTVMLESGYNGERT